MADTTDKLAIPVAPELAPQFAPPAGVTEAITTLGDDDVPFTLESWAGFPKYQCRYCVEAFVEDEMAAWLHYRDWHQFRTQTGEITRERRALSVDEAEAIQRAARRL